MPRRRRDHAPAGRDADRPDRCSATGIAADGVDEALRRLEARRAVLVSEPGAWARRRASARGDGLAARGLGGRDRQLPEGEAAKRLAVIEAAASELARLRVERDEPIVAIGGGALGDAAGFLAATYLRGIPVIHVPTTLVAQIDSSIGGKTAVDLPEGKNLVGAFHQPAAIVIDVAALADAARAPAPGRARRGGQDGRARRRAAVRAARARRRPAIARGDAGGRRARRSSPSSSSAAPGPRSRSSWPTSASAGRAAAGSRSTSGTRWAMPSRPRPATAACSTARPSRTGLRAACRIGVAVGVTPPERAARIGRPARRARARDRAPALPARRRPRPPRDRQEARRRAPALGPADGRRRRGPRGHRRTTSSRPRPVRCSRRGAPR